MSIIRPYIICHTAIDGRAGFAASFDGINISSEPFMLKLKSVQQLDNGTIWVRYSVR